MWEGVGGDAFPGDFGVSDNDSISVLVTEHRPCQMAATEAAGEPPRPASWTLSPPPTSPLGKLTGELQLGPRSLGA